MFNCDDDDDVDVYFVAHKGHNLNAHRQYPVSDIILGFTS